MWCSAAHQADWQALRGALIGCLALLRRRNTFGMVKGGDAKILAESFLKNVQVQSLAVEDRKVRSLLWFCWCTDAQKNWE